MKLARSLAKRRASRYEHGMFVAEGTRVIQALLEAGIELNIVLVDDARVTDIPAELLERLEASAARLVRVESRLYRDITTTETPQPLSAICIIPRPSLPAAPKLIVLLDRLADPGNAGTIIRSAAAFGADIVAITRETVDPYNPKTVRSTAGTIGLVPILPVADLEHLRTSLNLTGATALFADSHAKASIYDVHWRAPVIIIFGSEPHGISQASRDQADMSVRIPMRGPVESLNVAAAASIILHHISDEIDRQM
ncbi:MAG: TrmH family RNA methyltransferase [Chloroflexota bacterium]